MLQRMFFVLALLGLLGSAARGEESSEFSRGFTFYERFQGSVNTLGAVTRLDTTVGYNFNTYFSVAAGIPVYFVRPSASATAATGTRAGNGIGNVYGQFRLTVPNERVNFASTLTVTAPTGDQDNGFSTGKATVDWSNYFEHTIARITPFGNVGIANSISDTMFFLRPYTTQGFVAHVEGGARYRLLRTVNVGASAYAIEPSGHQTVVSRLVVTVQPTPTPSPQPGPGRSGRGGSNQGVFEIANVTAGTADIARDHGVSLWTQLRPDSTFDFYLGYSRSMKYALDTVFFGVGVNLGKAFRHWGM